METTIAVEHDVFAVRQRGRDVAAALGIEGQDQVRVATALSEVGRQLLATLGGAGISFELADAPFPMLAIRARASKSGEADTAALTAELAPAERLMDHWRVDETPSEFVVTMGKRLPTSARSMTADDIAATRVHLSKIAPSTPLQELAVQNRNLLATLEEIQAHRDELLRLNAELEETNRGVMALYGQLSDELEATNRGVVALYAELDEKSAQLREASEAKTRFLANVSHELRAPATAIIGLLRLLSDSRSDPLTQEQRHQVSLINGSASDLLSLVNELLDLAKAESGRLDPQWTTVELPDMFDTLRGTMNPLINKSGLTLDVAEPSGIPAFTSDSVLLAQILRNLLTNAIKFTTSGVVRLSAEYRATDDVVELSVSDTGPGIPEDEIERVFEEFYQLSSTAQVAIKGTGLGLPYARRLATLLGGSLTLASTVGEGSVFTVTIPARLRPAVATTQHPSLILVVDDDEAFRTAVAGVLTTAGARVVQAANGRAALAAIARETPDVVLLDLRMPELDGAAVLDKLNSDENLTHIPVVVLTAFTQDVARSWALPRATAVLGKADTALDSLPDLIRSALRTNARPRKAEP